MAVAIVGVFVLLLAYAFFVQENNPFTMLFNKKQFEYNKVKQVAETHFGAKHYDQAVPELEKMIELRPEEVRPRYMLGISYARLGYPDKSVEQFEKVLQLDENHDGAMAGLASVYLRLGMEQVDKLNYPKAEEYYIKALNQIARAMKRKPTNQDYKKIQDKIVEERTRLGAIRSQ